MITCSLAVCLQTVLAAIYYALLSKDPEIKGGNPSPVEKALNAGRWLVVVCLYLGFAIVCVGVCTMPAPDELWGAGGGPKVSPAVACTILLATFYFAVFFCIELVKNVDEFLTPEGQRFGVLAPQTVFLRDVATTVDICPMLCILFLTARLRALQLDPKTGNPQSWTQTFFYLTSFSVFGLVVLCVVVAWLLRRDETAGQENPRLNSKARAAEFLRALCMLILIVGALVIVISMYLQKSKEGPTPSIPPSIKCVMIMTMVYFIVYTSVWFINAMRRLQTRGWNSTFVINLSKFLEEKAKAAIDFCPMLSILFLGTFMRALQITAGRGAPQPWAQTFMYVGAMAVVLMTIARIDTLLFPAVSADGSPSKPPNRRVLAFFNVLQHLCLLMMYMAVVAVVIALFTMTPETATGSGAMLNLSTYSGII